MKRNEKFIEFRNRLGLSQHMLASSLSVSQGTITDIERGRIGVSKRIQKKIQEIFGIEIGYFDKELQVKYNEIKGGTEIGVKEGLGNKLSESEQLRDLATRRMDDLRTNANKIKQLEKQKVIAEKIFKELYETSNKYKLFKQSVIKIQNFDNILDNLNFSDNINCVLKFDMAAKKYLELPYNDFKQALITDFETFKPYVPVFKDLALAIETFVRRLKEMPTEITGIDQEEMNQYEALVS